MLATLRYYLPVLDWLPSYRRDELSGDLIAGTITAILLVPQAMAYALLAGLPPQVGLYASIAPPILYTFFGSSRTMAVGPVAVASLLVGSALAPLAVPGSADYVAAALVLALLVGMLLIVLGLLRAGFVANFLSHPVMSGFTSAAAVLIVFSQLKHLLGLPMGNDWRIDETARYVLAHLGDINPTAALLGLLSIVALVYMQKHLARLLVRWGVQASLAGPLAKAGPLLLVLVAIAITWLFGLDGWAHLAVVGTIPAGLPGLTVPQFQADQWQALASSALLIALVSFVESVSIAKVLASRRRQKINANQELVGLGIANLGAAFTGGCPVCGGLSRSVVNYAAGANTQIAALVTAGFLTLAVLLLTPVFYYLPQTVLAAIIVVAIVTLIDLKTLRHVWHYNKADAASLLFTFGMVLVVGIEAGIIAGVVFSLALYVWRTSQPHIAIVGRVGDTEHFRNIKRHQVRTYPQVLALRVDESLYFANTKYLEDYLLAAVADQPPVTQVVLICSAVNFIDASALESLESLIEELRKAGVTLHLAEIKGPVMDKLKTTDFLERLAPGQVFLSTHEAMRALDCP